jgi:hypothetical protein
MGAPNLALNHLALNGFCRQQHDKVVAPPDPAIDFGRPIGTDAHPGVDEDFVAARF